MSTGRQASEGISLEHQQEAVETYCRLQHIELVELRVDAGLSAYKQPLRRRTEGARVLEMVAARQVGSVVALRLDRLFRSIRDCINTVMDWDKAGVRLHLVDMGGAPLDTGTPMGRMMITLMAGFGEMESHAKAERARDAWEHHRAQGKRLGSVAPYGYCMDEDGRMLPDEHEQAAVRAIQALRAQGLSIAKVAHRLEQQGYRPRGARWHPKTIIRILERTSSASDASTRQSPSGAVR